jgi:hypothetical protein
VARKPTDTVKLNLRFPEALRRRLEREARAQNRSLNTEIVERLYRSFEQSRDRINLIAEALLSELDHKIINRMLELIDENQAAMAAHDEWKERSR